MQRLRVVLELVDCAADDDAPAVIRLKGVLKSLLRRWGFRCTRATYADPAGAGEAGGNALEGEGPPCENASR